MKAFLAAVGGMLLTVAFRDADTFHTRLDTSHGSFSPGVAQRYH
jgi:hypothetical protein